MSGTFPSGAGRGWRVAMRARDSAETHRTATPLELLFDLTFVVAVAQVAAQLAHSIADDHPGQGLLSYLMVFFAIWWAWMNFTWFASAYDTDDVGYRLLTMVQMGGVLVLAAGVPAAFDDQRFGAVTLGYVIMRAAMLAQWLRAARGDSARRPTSVRYAAGTAAVQVAWVLRLLLPPPFGFAGFFVLVAAELLVPVWAEHAQGTAWHPHHIAERYGLITIFVLGECVLAATTAVQASVAQIGATMDHVVLGVAALLLLFGLWWIYFLRSAGPGLEQRRQVAFLWGYGHYGIFAALAAIGAGVEVAAEALTHHIAASTELVTYAIAVPVAVCLLLIWAIHAPLRPRQRREMIPVLLAVVATLALASTTLLGLPLPWTVLLLCTPVAALVVAGVIDQHRRVATSTG
ncbi:MAG: low temperature requirement protein A [Nocardioidaceae bacterium]